MAGQEMGVEVTDVPEEDQAAQAERAIQDELRLNHLSSTLSAKRTKAIDARVGAGIDRRWYEDVEAYEGRDELTRAYLGLREQVQGYLQGYNESHDTQTKKRSTLVVNVTRQKVNASSSRLADIALPTDDRNWGLRPSTVPDLVRKMGQRDKGLTLNGAPIMLDDKKPDGTVVKRQATMSDYAKMTTEEAKQAANAMQDEIDDQLDMSAMGCGWEGVIRTILDDCALLGVGIIKGPTITTRTKKIWVPVTVGDQTIHRLSRIKELKPQSSRVDPWDFYPHQDCGENVKKGAGTWERSRVTAAEIRQMASVEGYLIPQLKKVLREGPRKVGVKEQTEKPGTETIVDTDTIFEQWEYHGQLEREDLEAAGNEIPDDDIFTTYSGVVIMINDTVVKADIEILDTEELPYDILVINKCSGSWAGYGDAFLARSAQRAITAGWRAMMDNAGQIVGGQVVINRKKIAPADGRWELSGMKCWFALGDDTDVRNVFAVHEIPSHQAEYAAIIKMGMEFLDQETALPMLAQGEQGEATDVLGGMTLLMNASNVMMRRKLKCLDDQITVPHIGRYVDWNMQYNPKQEIKGDFEVQARASGALLEQDIQNKGAMNLLAIGKDPDYALGFKKWDGLRRVVKSLRFDPNDFVLSDEDIKQKEEDIAKQGAPGDPRIEVEKIRAENKAQITKMEQDWETNQNELDRQNKLAVAVIDERMKSTELTSGEKQTLAKIKAQLADTAIKVNAQKEVTRNNQLLDLHKHGADQKRDMVKHNDQMQKDVLKPAVEPPGRAPVGQAFVQ